ncbi:MAG: flavodoxin family protein [Oscillospiraceae bacterium]|jgi:multimeric flavodoxin WrbA|nr:flavodoxin family protein [Oscillospiraceae bacterium]
MKILILCGSPHKNGTTNALAEALISGIDQSRHEVEKIQLAEKKIAPCLGCEYCKRNDGACVQKDDMAALLPSVLAADVIVFVSPIYYFGFNAQLKAVIDRFYAVNARLKLQTQKKAILLTAGGGKEEWIPDGIFANYHTMLRYLNWTSLGQICALNCHVKDQLAQTTCLEQAKELGRSL